MLKRRVENERKGGVKKWIFLFVIVILCLSQVTLLNRFSIFNVRPDFLLAVLVIGSLDFDLRWVLILSIFAGMLKDIFGASPVAVNTVLFPLWGFLLHKLSRLINIDEILIQMVLVSILFFVHNIFTGLILISLGELIPLGIFMRILFLGSFLTALFFPLVLEITKLTELAKRRIKVNL